MTNDTLLPFDLPAVRSKKVIADFEGGLTSLDGGLVLLREAELRFGPGRDPGRLHPGLAQAGNGGPRAVGDAALPRVRHRMWQRGCSRLRCPAHGSPCSIWPSAGRGRAGARRVRSRRWADWGTLRALSSRGRGRRGSPPPAPPRPSAAWPTSPARPGRWPTTGAFDQIRQRFARTALLKARFGPRKREGTLGGRTALVPVSFQRSEPKPHRIQVRTMQPWRHYGRRCRVAEASQADSISLSLQFSLAAIRHSGRPRPPAAQTSASDPIR